MAENAKPAIPLVSAARNRQGYDYGWVAQPGLAQHFAVEGDEPCPSKGEQNEAEAATWVERCKDTARHAQADSNDLLPNHNCTASLLLLRLCVPRHSDHGPALRARLKPSSALAEMRYKDAGWPGSAGGLVSSTSSLEQSFWAGDNLTPVDPLLFGSRPMTVHSPRPFRFATEYRVAPGRYAGVFTSPSPSFPDRSASVRKARLDARRSEPDHRLTSRMVGLPEASASHNSGDTWSKPSAFRALLAGNSGYVRLSR
jgi:hypothetical protein